MWKNRLTLARAVTRHTHRSRGIWTSGSCVRARVRVHLVLLRQTAHWRWLRQQVAVIGDTYHVEFWVTPAARYKGWCAGIHGQPRATLAKRWHFSEQNCQTKKMLGDDTVSFVCYIKPLTIVRNFASFDT